MNNLHINELIKIDGLSSTPKYLQIVQSIINNIEAGHLTINSRLPSINEVSFEIDISRDTIEKAYKHLKNLNIIGSVPSKGYFIKKIKFENYLKICLFFNKLSLHKKIIYDSFVANIGSEVTIDFYIFNNDLGLFKKLLTDKLSHDYSHFVVIPHFLETNDTLAVEILNTIPKDKLLLLDKLMPGLTGEFAAVYENFEKDIYFALKGLLKALGKYQSLKIIFPAHSYFPKEILEGFLKFCQDFAFEHVVVYNIEAETISKGDVFINLMESDLVILIEKILKSNFVVGTDVGVISYNETPMKQIILNGITTISTDFKEMGAIAAKLILNNSKEHIENQFEVVNRNSL